ncbi:MAG: hypothetical protein JSV09_16745 [Thermoplasmata archaeon]|nr:MAG: hypothetical protein JSV09_16745 [Thermoplasmata archaeon]
MDNLAKELEDKQGKRIILTLGIIILVIVVGTILAGAISSAFADKPKDRPVLYIEDVFFVLSGTNAGSDEVTIKVTTFITNRGTADAKEIQIVAFVIETDSNLAMDKTTYSVGSLKKDKTQISEFSLTMPNNESYAIKLILMENGKIAVRGSGTVNLEENLGGRGTRFKTDEGDDSSFYEEGVFAEETFPVMIFLLGGAVFFVIIMALRKKSSSIASSSMPSVSQNSDNMEHYFPPPPQYQEPEVLDADVLLSNEEDSLEQKEPQINEIEGDSG